MSPRRAAPLCLHDFRSRCVPQSRTFRTRTLATATAVVLAAGALPALTSAASAAPQQSAHQLRADLNGDGYEDLAVGAPYATVGGKARAGYVAVLYGSAAGLSARKVYTQASAGIPGAVEQGDLFGGRLTTADLDGDGYTDLLVDSGNERWSQDGIDRQGSRTVLWGGSKGVGSGSLLPAEGTGIGQAYRTVAGDFDGDGHQDLAHNGRVLFSPFGRDGRPANTQEGAAFSDGDLNTVAAAVGDTDGDGFDDIVTLARTYDPDDEGQYGTYVYYARGGRDGLRAPVRLSDLTGPPADTVALGDLDGDHRAPAAPACASTQRPSPVKPRRPSARNC